jgi:hypothetical protein
MSGTIQLIPGGPDLCQAGAVLTIADSATAAANPDTSITMQDACSLIERGAAVWIDAPLRVQALGASANVALVEERAAADKVRVEQVTATAKMQMDLEALKGEIAALKGAK